MAVETAYLYRFTSPSGKVYFGIAKSPKKRWLEHSQAARSGSDCVLHKAIRKYGLGSFKKEVLVKSDYDYVKSLEIKAIAAFGTLLPGGYNMTAGGDGTVGYVVSDEQKRVTAEKNRGQKRTPETCERISESLKGRALPEDVKQKIGKASSAVVRTQEWKARISSALKGVPQSAEVKAARAEKQRLKWQDPEYRARQLELQREGLSRKAAKDPDDKHAPVRDKQNPYGA